jgi:hypothetical protein
LISQSLPPSSVSRPIHRYNRQGERSEPEEYHVQIDARSGKLLL